MKAKKKPKQEVQSINIVSDASKQKYLLLSFVFPFAILGTVFALHGVYPFGNKQILRGDFYHQYFPFFNGLWHKLREGAVSPWSWTASAGHDYVALIAYYMASPLNLLIVIVPHAWLREALTVILLVKIGCAGLFTAMYLRYAYKEYGPALPVFSSLYALCAFSLGYYHNTMWFDSFALLPLVMLGLLALMNEGKYRLYIVSLALAVLVNFYMGYIICIFVVITFFCRCVIQRLNLRDFLRKLGSVVACSALAAGLTAILTIPTWSALQSIYSTPPASPTLSLYHNFFDVLGNFIAFTPPTAFTGLPNLYCGMISVLLAGLFMKSQKIAFREKIVLAGILVFLILSCNLDVLSFMMHGFRYPVGYPARFSFLISFVLVAMAYRAFLLTEGIDKQGLLLMGITAALFLLSAVFGLQEKKYIIGSAVVFALYILSFYFLMKAKTVKARKSLRTAFFLVILTELSVTSYISIKTVGTTSRDEYYDQYKQIQALLNKRKKIGVDFYRTDTDGCFIRNEPYFYNYDGISLFSSTINPDVLRFMQGLGLESNRSNYNHFTYFNTSPLANAFLNMRYMISHRGYAANKNVYWETIGKVGDSLILENKYYLPLGFMVNEELAGYKQHNNLFISQNYFFHMATGIDDDLFTVFDISALAEKKDDITVWSYHIPITGMTYAYCMIDEPNTITSMTINTKGAGFLQRRTLTMSDHMPYVFPVGSMEQGDIAAFLLDIDRASIYVGHLNGELFEQGYAKLASQPLNLTKFTNTQVCGNVTVIEDGLLYTSIPADKNWSVFVDGVKSEIVLIDNAMIAVRLNKGYHEIELRYFNKSFLAGVIVSLVSLGVFIALIVFKKKRIAGS